MMIWNYIKAYSWVFVAIALVVVGYMIASQRMRQKALEMQVEALQSLMDAKARRQVRDDAIDAKADSDAAEISGERDDALAELDAKEDALPGPDHDALDSVDDDVNAYLRGER